MLAKVCTLKVLEDNIDNEYGETKHVLTSSGIPCLKVITLTMNDG